MPKITFTDSKGLVSKSGKGVVFEGGTTFKSSAEFEGGGELSGFVKKRTTLSGNDYTGNRIFLSGSDSGQTFILGDAGASYTVHIPAVNGWHARFTTTGSQSAKSLTHSVHLTASTDFGAIAADNNPFCGVIVGANDGASVAAAIHGGTPNGGGHGMVSFRHSGVTAKGGDFVDVEVTSAAAVAVILVNGSANT
jgi:hypothetical protein